MPQPFDSITLRSLTLPNRFVRSATWEGLAADDGSMIPALTERMAELARGEVGLIIRGHAFVSREGQAGLKQLGTYGDALEVGLVKRWREGDRRRAECVSDNACYASGFAGEGIRCVTFEKKRVSAARAD